MLEPLSAKQKHGNGSLQVEKKGGEVESVKVWSDARHFVRGEDGFLYEEGLYIARDANRPYFYDEETCLVTPCPRPRDRALRQNFLPAVQLLISGLALAISGASLYLSVSELIGIAVMCCGTAVVGVAATLAILIYMNNLNAGEDALLGSQESTEDEASAPGTFSARSRMRCCAVRLRFAHPH